MARRMKQQKEYYWQGKGGPDVTLGKIVNELLGRDFDKAIGDPIMGSMGEATDVYTLQFDCWNDSSAYEGHSIIHIPHNEDNDILFNMVLLTDDDITTIAHRTPIDNSLINGIEDLGFAIYLRKIASNQPHRFDYS